MGEDCHLRIEVVLQEVWEGGFRPALNEQYFIWGY